MAQVPPDSSNINHRWARDNRFLFIKLVKRRAGYARIKAPN
jgi:hypothetical protein